MPSLASWPTRKRKKAPALGATGADCEKWTVNLAAGDLAGANEGRDTGVVGPAAPMRTLPLFLAYTPRRNDPRRGPTDLDFMKRRRSARDNRRGLVPSAKFGQFDSCVVKGRRVIGPAICGGDVGMDRVFGVAGSKRQMAVVDLYHTKRQQGRRAALQDLGQAFEVFGVIGRGGIAGKPRAEPLDGAKPPWAPSFAVGLILR